MCRDSGIHFPEKSTRATLKREGSSRGLLSIQFSQSWLHALDCICPFASCSLFAVFTRSLAGILDVEQEDSLRFALAVEGCEQYLYNSVLHKHTSPTPLPVSYLPSYSPCPY